MDQLALFDQPMDQEWPERIGRAKVTTRKARSILTQGSGALSGFDFTLNPYVGCSFGCSYCYAAFFVLDEQRQDWGKWVEIKANALHLLQNTKDLAGSRILIGSATDPYQPLEAKVRITRSLLDYMAKVSPAPEVVIQTRSPLAAQDIETFQKIPGLRVNMSVTTDCEEVRKRYEPGCASIERRLEALEEINRAGVRTGLSLAPLLPVRDPAAFARRLKRVNPSMWWAGYFHETRGDFIAGTRPDALQMAKREGWTRERFEQTRELIKQHMGSAPA